MDAIEQEFQPNKRNSEVMSSFGFRLYNQFVQNESFRRMKEIQWLEDLRAYKGIYDPEVKIEPNNSKVYVKLTRSKINIVLSRLHEMLFPETDKNWEIAPTPEPRLSPAVFQKIVKSLMDKAMMEQQAFLQQNQTMEAQQVPPPSLDDVKVAIKKYAESTCQAMSNVIEDQLIEMDYPEETKKVLRSGLTYGTGVIKGPMIKKREKRRWEQDEKGEYMESINPDETPYFEAVRICDWYPDMTVTDMSMIEGSFERHLMTKHDIRQLLKRDDYYHDIITQYLTDHPTGDYTAKNWEIDLQTIEVMAATGRSSYTMQYGSTDSSTNGENRVTNRQLGKKYQVLEYWGYVDGSDLAACGVEVPDVTLEYGCNVWLLGKQPIKAVLFDGALDMYKVFYYEKDETSLFGEGLARVMRHSQLAVSASARMILDNGACVTGDTEVYRSHRSNDRPCTLTVRDLWNKKKQWKNGLKRNKIRCLNEDTGELYYNRVIDVFNNGFKPVYRIETEHGYTIKATGDHKLISDSGDWQELDQFCIGDLIAVNGTAKKPQGKCIDCGSPTSRKGVRCRKCSSKLDNSKWNQKQVDTSANNLDASKSTARQRWLCQKDKKNYCEKCGKSVDVVRLCIHHKDKNPHNNEEINKLTVCQPCHVAIHHRNDYFGKPYQHKYIDFDHIINIEFVGNEEVFDIQMDNPDHNFIANGFVVHNCVAGPQVEINWSLMTPNTDFNSFYPRKIWYREGRGVEAQYPAVRDIQFDSHIPDLLKIADFFEQSADKETTLPTWMIGQMVNNETAQATSGRMATITVSIKDVVKNFDSFTEKIIRDLYSWNMEFNPRSDIKGDYNIKAKGVSSLVMKEIRMQALNQFMQTVSPEDWVYLDRRELLKERLKAHDLNVALKTEEEADQIRQQQQNSEINRLQIEAMRAQISKDKAQAMSNLTKAKEKNIEANKASYTPPEQAEQTSPEMQQAQVAKELAGVEESNAKIRMMERDQANREAELRQTMEHDRLQNVLDMSLKTDKHTTEMDIKKKSADHAMTMKEKAQANKNKQKTSPKEK